MKTKKTTGDGTRTKPRIGHVHVNSWAGRTRHPCEVLGECVRRGKRHYRVRVLEAAFRWRAGQVLYPPASAVTFDDRDG